MNKLIQVFEHQSLKVNPNGDFNQSALEALQRHYGQKGKPYYSLIHNGVRFNQFVGVIKTGNITIEVLPKVDKQSKYLDNEKPHFWQKRLIDVLLAVNSVDAKITSVADLNLKANSILDVYFALFIREVESLLHKGLIKHYHKQQANLATLKGRLDFSQHIGKNIIHQERFFVEYTVYDQHNIYNQILYKTIKLVSQLSSNQQLSSRINLLLLNFSEMADIYVDNSTFDKIIYNRKNQHYESALTIAKLLLLNYHPDIKKGHQSVLALMFDMNQLWEKFVLISLRRNNCYPHIRIKEQQSKPFWCTDRYAIKVRPDIIISNIIDNRHFVLDTKWKCPAYQKPSVDDLRQLYSYHHYYQADKVALIYPALDEITTVSGNYTKVAENEMDKTCSLLFLHITKNEQDIVKWQKHIYQSIFIWCGII